MRPVTEGRECLTAGDARPVMPDGRCRTVSGGEGAWRSSLDSESAMACVELQIVYNSVCAAVRPASPQTASPPASTRPPRRGTRASWAATVGSLTPSTLDHFSMNVSLSPLGTMAVYPAIDPSDRKCVADEAHTAF